MKNTKHVQCRLRRGHTHMIAWIPKDCAIINRVVDLDDPEEGESKGWTVEAVNEPALSSKWVQERSRDHKNQRGMSDI